MRRLRTELLQWHLGALRCWPRQCARTVSPHERTCQAVTGGIATETQSLARGSPTRPPQSRSHCERRFPPRQQACKRFSRAAGGRQIVATAKTLGRRRLSTGEPTCKPGVTREAADDSDLVQLLVAQRARMRHDLFPFRPFRLAVSRVRPNARGRVDLKQALRLPSLACLQWRATDRHHPIRCESSSAVTAAGWAGR